jgi:hypothetical protein
MPRGIVASMGMTSARIEAAECDTVGGRLYRARPGASGAPAQPYAG